MKGPAHVSVVICAYTEGRWDQLQAAIASALRQPQTAEVIVVSDHNDVLLQRLRHTGAGAIMIANTQRQGLSGARNSGVAAATQDLVAFLDDDAEAHDDWLRMLVEPFEDPQVESVGGKAEPKWSAGPSRLLPPELLWIVGCTFTGQPLALAEVRNVMGCSMAFRRETLLALGGFDPDTGRIGRVPLGGEETDLCIRLRVEKPFAKVLFEPRSLVSHNVSSDRLGWNYLVKRSFFEGVSKSALTRKLGHQATRSERAYTTSVLPRGVVRELRLLRLDGVRRATAIVVSLFSACAGFVYGSARARDAVVATEPAVPMEHAA